MQLVKSFQLKLDFGERILAASFSPGASGVEVSLCQTIRSCTQAPAIACVSRSLFTHRGSLQQALGWHHAGLTVTIGISLYESAYLLRFSPGDPAWKLTSRQSLGSYPADDVDADAAPFAHASDSSLLVAVSNGDGSHSLALHEPASMTVRRMRPAASQCKCNATARPLHA